jgi:hypothetical protein
MVAHGPRGISESSAPRAPVEIATLGRFAIIARGTDAEPATGRPLTLLKLIIALGGHDVSAAQVSDALWPDADGHAAAACPIVRASYKLAVCATVAGPRR